MQAPRSFPLFDYRHANLMHPMDYVSDSLPRSTTGVRWLAPAPRLPGSLFCLCAWLDVQVLICRRHHRRRRRGTLEPSWLVRLDGTRMEQLTSYTSSS